MRWVLRGVAALVLLASLAWAALHWVIVPRIDDFRPRLEALASRTVGVPVTIGSLSAESNALVPAISLHDVQVRSPDGQVGLRVPRVLAAFSVLSLARGGLTQLVVEQPELELRRTTQGRLLVGGIDLSGDSTGDSAGADWFFSQPEFMLQGGRVTWVDEQRAAPPIALHDVRVVVRNGRREHQIRFDALPPQGWGDEAFTLVGQFRQPIFNRHAGEWTQWSGQVFANLPRTDVLQLRQYVDLRSDWGVDLREGRGALRAWAEVRRGEVISATADVQLDAVSASFGEHLSPLTFGNLGGRLSWRNVNGDVEFDTRNLHFVDAGGAAWPGGNLVLNYRNGRNGSAAGGELRGDKLDLTALARIASSLPLPDQAQAQLKAHPLKGVVDNFSASWVGKLDAPSDWTVQARVSALTVGTIAPEARWPGVDGASLELTAKRDSGQAHLTVRNGAVELPGVLEEPRVPLSDLSLKARWRVQGERIEVDVDELNLSNADTTGSFQAKWHTSEVKNPDDTPFPGVLDLSGTLSRTNGARVYRYLPTVIPADARRYVREAIQKGEARDFAVRIKGPLNEVPFDRQPADGEFRFAGRVAGVTMAYVPKFLQPKGQPAWPALEDLAGELVFERNGMQVRNASAKVKGYPGWQFANIQTRIADMGHTRVQVEAEGKGVLATALNIVRRSPVSGFTDQVLDEATGTGDAALRLKLDLPIDDMGQAKAEGQAVLQGNDVRITPTSPALAQARGTVAFSNAGFAVQDVRVRALGGEARISGGTATEVKGASPVVLRINGTATTNALREMQDWAPVSALMTWAAGSTTYDAVVGFHAGGPDVQVTTDLRGITLDLPFPLGKAADAAWPLRYEVRRQQAHANSAARDRVRVALADRLALDYELDATAQPARVLRGAVGVGPQATRNLSLPASGVSAQLQLPLLDVDAWEALSARMSSPQGNLADASAANPAESGATTAARAYLPTAWEVRVGELKVHERLLHDLVSNGVREGATWRANLQSREMAGRLAFSEGVNNRPGKLQARLTRLVVPEGTSEEQAALLTEPPANMPALDIVADDFELRGKKLGRLEVQAVNQDQDWQLNTLSLRMREATFTARGHWRAKSASQGAPRRTELNFDLDVSDAGTLLTRLEMPGVLARGKGSLSGTVGWDGAPVSPHYPSMSGQLHLDVGAGQFLKASPGVGKLLGVLSLQALPRRLSMDFRDVFSAGFAFDFVRGDVRVQRGVAHTSNLQMKGVNAAVLMEGSADLDKETQDLRVLVVPDIDAGTAALAAAVINPVVGLGAFVAQLILKEPINRAATREFQVDGSWANPQVTPVPLSERGASALAAASTAAASAPAAAASVPAWAETPARAPASMPAPAPASSAPLSPRVGEDS